MNDVHVTDPTLDDTGRFPREVAMRVETLNSPTPYPDEPLIYVSASTGYGDGLRMSVSFAIGTEASKDWYVGREITVTIS